MCRAVAIFVALTVALAGAASAQESSELVTENGVTYRVTKRITQRQLPVTEYETRQETYYQPQATPAAVPQQQLVMVPVTQYQWVPKLRGEWNPFGEPYYEYEMEPVTRWEQRTMAMPSAAPTTQWVPQTRTVQVPVTRYRTVSEESFSKVAVSIVPNSQPVQPQPGNLSPSRDAVPQVATRPSNGGSPYDPPSAPTAAPPQVQVGGGDRYR